MRDPWVPALLATVLVALSGHVVAYAEKRKAAGSEGGHDSAP
ncbi:hypothetical protein [Streptomyces sp. NPDC000229]